MGRPNIHSEICSQTSWILINNILVPTRCSFK